MKQSGKIKSITLAFLSSFLELADDLVEASLSRKAAYRIINRNFGRCDYNYRKFDNTINNLRTCGYIKTDPRNNSIILTNKAKMKMVDQIALKIPKENSYHFVSFDIPEQLRLQRDRFRRIIKKLGFVQIQKSLWVCNKNVGEFVEIASYEYKVEKYVIYLVSTKSNIDEFIGKKLTEK